VIGGIVNLQDEKFDTKEALGRAFEVGTGMKSDGQ
jgi:hypothetical protein